MGPSSPSTCSPPNSQPPVAGQEPGAEQHLGLRRATDEEGVGGQFGAGFSVRRGRVPRCLYSAAAERTPKKRTTVDTKASNTELPWALFFAAWLIAAMSVAGALFFSEVMELPPCVLCWYQRIFMFPLALLLPLGLFPFDARVVRYTLPLSLAGTAIAVYHLLLVLGVIPEGAAPCSRGVPCAEVQIEWLGFVTIPLLSAVAFSAITALLITGHRKLAR